MATYFDEHPVEDSPLAVARLMVESGYAMQIGLDLDRLFPDGRSASEKEIEALKRLRAEEVMKEGETTCPICLCEYEENDKLLEMPCGHRFHNQCALVWLKKMNSCPLCRKKLPDPLEEEWKRQEKRKQERREDIEELHNNMYS